MHHTVADTGSIGICAYNRLACSTVRMLKIFPSDLACITRVPVSGVCANSEWKMKSSAMINGACECRLLGLFMSKIVLRLITKDQISVQKLAFLQLQGIRVAVPERGLYIQVCLPSPPSVARSLVLQVSSDRPCVQRIGSRFLRVSVQLVPAGGTRMSV